MEYFDDFFYDIENFQRNFLEKIRKEMEALNEAIRSGELKGQWDLKEIDEPNMKGYIIQGYYNSDNTLDPMNPLESLRPYPIRPKRPLPQKPSLTEVREPLTDVYEDKKSVKICVELPGVEKEDIQLNVTKDEAEIKAKKFYKTLKLPTADVDAEKISASYKNGVLEAIIPKKKMEKNEKTKKIQIE